MATADVTFAAAGSFGPAGPLDIWNGNPIITEQVTFTTSTATTYAAARDCIVCVTADADAYVVAGAAAVATPTTGHRVVSGDQFVLAVKKGDKVALVAK